MPKILNLSLAEVYNNQFPNWVNDDCILIQIQNVDNYPKATFCPIPMNRKFAYVYQFRIEDTEVDCATSIKDDQAKDLAEILQDSLSSGRSVVAHCHAGVSRSGAVTECGVQLGFEDTGRWRNPNRLIKRRILEQLGLNKQSDYYDELW